MMAGNYFQSLGAKIFIGKGTYIAPNVGIITTNHDIKNPEKHVIGQDVIIGANCWIGMNAMILPGVKLGDHTVIGAGAVVTKSFPEGFCVIAGNPAKKIKEFSI
ncbi:MAG: DapH/DapD/GlmU-related protein [Bacilli bacterium]|nr:DapH/DapD/GlmU-related protein [Bacilli bacterium]